VFDHSHLSKADLKLGEHMAEDPFDFWKLAIQVVRDLQDPDRKKVHPTIHLTVGDNEYMGREPGHSFASEVGSLVYVEGLVRRRTQAKFFESVVYFKCTRCGAEMGVPQASPSKLRRPINCDSDHGGCNRGIVGQFERIGARHPNERLDYQEIELAPIPGLAKHVSPEGLKVVLKGDFVNSLEVGHQARIDGIPHVDPEDEKPVRRWYFQATSIEVKGATDLEITEAEENSIRDLASADDALDTFASSLAPHIHGMEGLKRAVALQLVGGVQRGDSRGRVHVLAIGDPGTARSKLLRWVSGLLPRGTYLETPTSTAAGIVATVERRGEEGWELVAGALPLANGSIVSVDELEKAKPGVYNDLLGALEYGEAHVAKASINATLPCDVTFLGACNPTGGRWDPYQPPDAQIDLPAPLLSRMDLIYYVTDPLEVPDQREALVDHILNGSETTSLDPHLLSKWVLTAQQVQVEIPKKVKKVLKVAFLEMVNKGQMEIRRLDTLRRLCEAHARLHLREVAILEDARTAVSVLQDAMDSRHRLEVGECCARCGQNLPMDGFKDY